MIILLVAALAVIGSSMAAFLADPATPGKSRSIKAGRAALMVPVYFPGEILSGTVTSGSAIMGSKDDCDITYDQFFGVFWSERPVPERQLLPTDAYRKVSEINGPAIDLGKGRRAGARSIRLSAKKPCGRIVRENLKVVELYCVRSKTHIAIVGMLDPVVTEERVAEIARSLKCP